ncbi:MAG: hypothetical protein R3F31_02040 [Verrucomicrobiales bacterium]
MSKLLHDWQGRLKAVDFEKLSPDQRVDYVLLRNEPGVIAQQSFDGKRSGRELLRVASDPCRIDALTDAPVSRGEPIVPETRLESRASRKPSQSCRSS